MKYALRLAVKSRGKTSPNPLVGALVVKSGVIIGKGHHRRAGAPHAEIEALRQAGTKAHGANLYVTLEPCNHIGRTPPCCDSIISSGISKVIIAAKDTNPITNGRGITRLRRSGIRVTTGLMEAQSRMMNAPFHKTMEKQLPWVVVKMAQSLDGKIATKTGESKWITSALARKHSHSWREKVDAILVGLNTVVEDDPRLSARSSANHLKQPIKIIVDSTLRTPKTARCLRGAKSNRVIIATTKKVSHQKISAFKKLGIDVYQFPEKAGKVPLKRLFQKLVREGIQSILIEGGSEVIASAFKEKLVDHVLCFIAPRFIGGKDALGSIADLGVKRLSQSIRLDNMSVRRFGTDLCIEAKVRY